MTCRTARELLNVILGHQPLPEFELVRRWDVVDVEDLVARTHVSFRVPVAVEAPFHLQRLVLPHQRHAVHLAVAGRATNAFVHVNAVVEVHVVRQIVDASPLNRASRAEALAHGFEKRTVRENLRMAVHACLGGRNPGEPRLLDGGVAVPAVDPVAANVPLVTELNGLIARRVYLGHPGRTIHFGKERQKTGDEENSAEDADPSNRVGAAVKDLRHRREPRAIGPLVSLPRSTRAGALYFVKCFTLCQKQAESIAESVDFLIGRLWLGTAGVKGSAPSRTCTSGGSRTSRTIRARGSLSRSDGAVRPSCGPHPVPRAGGSARGDSSTRDTSRPIAATPPACRCRR